MRFQVTHKPVYQPPVPNIQIQPHSLVISNPVIFGNIYTAMISKGPCPSCG